MFVKLKIQLTHIGYLYRIRKRLGMIRKQPLHFPGFLIVEFVRFKADWSAVLDTAVRLGCT